MVCYFGIILLGTIIALWFYLAGVKRSRWMPSRARQAAFIAGVLLIYLALESPTDAMGDHSFLMHTVEHMALRFFSPVLIALAAPLPVLLRGSPRALKRYLIRPLARHKIARGAYVVLVHPFGAALLFIGALYVWHIPRLYNLVVLDDGVHEIMHLTMLISGLAFWWSMFDPRLKHSLRPQYGLRIVVLWLVTVPDILLGSYIVFTDVNLYPAYEQIGRLWLDAQVDQVIGGAVTWIPGGMMTDIASLFLFVPWMRADAVRHRALVARLEAEEAENAALSGR